MTDAKLPGERRELLEALMRERRERRRVRPVSFAQRRLWFLDQLLTESTLYNICFAFRLEGKLDVKVLARSLDEIVARHEILRTTIETRGGEPVQRIAEPAPLGLDVLDRASVKSADRDAEVKVCARDLGSRPFSLDQGPLIRARLVKLASDDHALVIAIHHIAYDGWSSGVLMRELAALYNAFSAGKPSPLEPLPIQYGDFASWQREHLRDENLRGHLEHWRQVLTGVSGLDLLTDHPRPPVPKYESERQYTMLPPDVAEGLEKLSRAAGSTMFATVLTVLKVLLYRYTGQADIVVGSPMAGRNRPETEKLIGCFVNSLVLRTDLSGNPTFRELLTRVRETALAAFEHEDLPFEKLVEALQPERDTSRNPFFQVLYSYQGLTDFQESRGDEARFGGLAFRSMELDSGTTRLDIEVYAFRGPDGLRVLVNYRKDLFDRDTIDRTLRHFAVLARGAVRNPDERIGQLPLLDDKERKLLLETWNNRPLELPKERTVHELFAAQAARTPHKIAVAFGEEHLTFAELRERAARLSSRLRALGVGPGDLAGIYLQRTPRMVEALLGVLGAGAAYVPLDPSYPSDRIGFMLDDARVRVLLTTGDLVKTLPDHGARVVRIDVDESPESAVASTRDAGPDDLAYVMYTSGSTGKPKGVQIPHRCVVNLLTSMGREPGLGPDDVLLSITTLSFDISVLEMFLPLTVGAKLVLVGRETAGDGLTLKRRIDEVGATVLQATPATWRILLEAGWDKEGGGRLKAICGGEAWGWDLAGPMVDRCSSVWNGYGPTEATVYASMRAVRPGEGRVNMGGAVANCALYVLDEYRQPTPIGVPGELYIGGAGVGNGYLNRPELTAEKFVPNPFDATSTTRLYRTGDKVRYRADGTIEFMGRLDHQVKVRGFRIEPGEIQNALMQHPCAKEVVVILREDRPGDQRLVTYVVTAGGDLPSTSELRAFLRQHLPEYMVPSVFVPMTSFPLTPSGKVDRKALPAPDSDRPGLGAERVEPQGPVQELVANIWASVLGVLQVGAVDNFFELGGHSLLATQVVSRIRESFGVELPLLEFFENPTVAGLAEHIDALRQRGVKLDSLELKPAPTGLTPVLSFGQQRFWFLEQMRAGTAAFNIHEAGRMLGDLDVKALRQALTEITRRHAVLRASFPKDPSGNALCRIAEPGPFDLAETDLSSIDESAREERVLEMAIAEARMPFDIATGPILRARLIRLAPAEHVFLFTIHHMVSDGWSMGIFWRELVALYTAFAAGQPSPLTELPLQYMDVAHWQRSWLTDERLTEQIDYWRAQLQGAPPLLEMPTDRARPAVEGSNGARASRALRADLTKALKDLAIRQDATLFMVMLACFKSLLQRYTAQLDIVVGVPIAGRTRSETENLIGLFVNSIVLRTDLTGDPSFLDLLRRVRAVSLAGFAHQDLPFERLVQALRPPRETSHHPLFQVMFTLQNAPRSQVQLTGLEMRPVGTKGTISQFDLTLFAWESGGELSLTAVYKTDLFDEATIEGMLGQLETLIEAVVANPKMPLSRLPLLSAESRHRLLNEWNSPSTVFPVKDCLHERFEAQVDRAPNAVAVTFEGKHLTYAELDSRANQLAHVLSERGVGPDVLVGLCLDRGLDLLVGILGILKAGGAYVPLDLANPSERIAFILEDSQVPVLVTESLQLEKLPAHAAQVVCLDRDREVLARASLTRPKPVAKPEHLAYVIYTSGSTGKPKGVMIEHRHVVRLFDATDELYTFGSQDVWTLFHSSAFDFSVWEIWGALFYGGRLVVVPYMTSRSPEEFHALLTREKVTVLNQTPSAFRALIAADQRVGVQDGLALKWVIFGGEALDLQSLAPWFERHGDVKPTLVNMYGITETTVHVTWRKLRVQDLTEAAGSVIGVPIPDLQVYVLDVHQQLSPIGVPGELYVGGAGVARGYLRRTELTAERFILDPFRPGTGARLYRSGDLARLTHDGDLLYLGRNDDQVKIRGFRIELGEIRAAFDRHPKLTASAVVIQKDPAGASRLVAYVVSTSEPRPTVSELRDFVKSQLPDYMVPAAIVPMDELPLTPNGKLDHRALPSPDFDRDVKHEEHVDPRTPAEEILARIWRDLLHVNKIGVHDNFFELGGHSLVATQVASRVRDSFQVELPLLELFEHPTVAGLTPRIEGLQRRDVKETGQDLRPAPAGTTPVLSFGQQRFWFLEQLQSGKAAFNIHAAGRMLGELDASALRRTLTEICRRHAGLRASFPKDEAGNAQCRIAEPGPFDLAETDLSMLDEPVREARAEALVTEEARKRFNIDTGPLVRARLIRMSSADHAFVLVVHHIVSDGWSMGIFWREFVALYTAFAAGQPSTLTELPLQYTDVALWQRNWLTDERLAEQLDYWKAQLNGIAPLLELPTDRPRPSLERFEGAHCTRYLKPELTQALKDLAIRQDATLFMVLLASFQALLQRYTAQSDVAVGVPIAGRTRAETEDLIGLFVNSLVLRTDLTGDPTFLELLTRVRAVSLAGFAHQETPFERLVQVLRPPRETSHHPLFQVMFALQNAPRSQVQLTGLELRPMSTQGTTSQFDLTLFASDLRGQLALTLEYKTSLFDDATIDGMLGQLETLIEAIAANADRPLSQLSALGPETRHRLLSEWNSPSTVFPVKDCLHERFEAQVDRAPNAVAVTFEGKHLTYAELDSRANQLAHVLSERGVGPDVLVGLCLDRGLDLLVGILGILKAGGAYVPLDLANPSERIAFILEDSQVPVLVTESLQLEKLPAHAAQVVCLDRDREVLARASLTRPKPVAKPEHLAYVIYTSGSTGKPKGVMIEHRHVVRLFDATDELYTFGSQDVWTLFHSSAFDFSVWEIWGALFYGGRLVVVPYMTSRSPEEFHALLTREKVTVLNQTPSAFRALIAADQRVGVQDGLALKWVIFGGEALDLQSLAPWFERHGDVKPTLVNMYGITETTVHVTWRKLRVQDLTEAAGSVIGVPIPDLQVYVLDAHQQLSPIGVPGELYVGGAGVARGYLRRPELTAERFILDPFRPGTGARLYRSGDLARLTHDGDLLYLGRNDDQVKIRGFRIELGEIRAAFDRHPKLTASAVVIQKDPAGASRLVAYVVSTSEPRPTVSDLRDFVKSQLPDYMVPAAIVPMDALPLTPNGKLDHRALPSPDFDRDVKHEEHVDPRTPAEEILARIWRDLLHVNKIGVHDNFFELGGHSLVATQVASRVRDSFQVELPLLELFEHPTVAGLTPRIEGLQRRDVKETGQDLRPAPAGTTPVLSFGQQRFWFLEQLQSETAAFNIHVAGRMNGALDVSALRRSLTEIARRHAVLRTSFPRDSAGDALCRIAEPGPFDLAEAELSSIDEGARESRARELVTQEARTPFHIDKGPLARARLLRLSPEEHIFVLTVHHMVSDAWSMGIFWREFVALYTAFAAGQPSPLTELPLQYTDVALWQREWLTDERLAEQLEYWKTQLQGIPPLLELPTDRPRPAVERFNGAHHSRRLTPSLTRALKELAIRQDATLFMVLLACFKALLQRYTGQTDIVVGVPIGGRTRAETEDLIGLFVNSLVLRTDLTGDPTYLELLTRVRSVSLGGFAHQEMPFERLVQALRPPRDLSHHPLFQVLFALQNAPRAQVQLTGLELQPLSTVGTTSQFDLALFASEVGDELALTATYKSDLFDESTIDGMLEQLETLVEGVVADPERRLSQLPLLPAESRRRVLEDWNATAESTPDAPSVHALFARQVERAPSAVAVEFEGRRLTYAELDVQSTIVARRLRAMGIDRGRRVGICLERGLTVPVALLGVLKSGAAYVPLDPTHPAERTNFILADVGMDALLTQGDLRARFEAQDVPMLMLESESLHVSSGADGGAAEAAAVFGSVSTEDLAYVIYTSGSTGRPKGVEITHGSVVNFLTSMHRSPGLRADDVFLSVTTLSFDIAVLEIFGPLTVGAKVVFVPAAVASDGLQLEAKLMRSRATVCQATPATWRLLLEARWAGDRRLKILCGGEAWTRQLADELLPRCGSLWNMYGPTETTVWSAVQRVEAGSAPVAIGTPVANTRLYILDKHCQPLPVGVPGELCIAGAGVARGYWNRPDLTADRFLADPFDNRPGSRLYRTGDRARRRADGTIEFMGRLDHQVKVHGFRIELGEIEAVLTQVSTIREVVCVAREFGPGDTRLVAYVVSDGQERPAVGDLQAALRVKLPDYMVPAVFVMLDSLPRTPNGKVDRAALPAPSPARLQAERSGASPATPWEKRLATIWKELLEIDNVSGMDNFFDLGGHSLLSMRVVARIENETGVRINPSELIMQTLGQVAASCERSSAAGVKTPSTKRGDAAPERKGWIRKMLGRGRRPGGP